MPTINLAGKRFDTELPTDWKLGRQITWTDDLCFKGKSAKIGEQSGFLIVVRNKPPGPIRFLNVSTFTLPKGQIVTEGIWDSKDAPENNFTLAITGGTNKYKKIRGEVDVTTFPGANPPDSYTAEFRIRYR
jgi:hypothetical protein